MEAPGWSVSLHSDNGIFNKSIFQSLLPMEDQVQSACLSGGLPDSSVLIWETLREDTVFYPNFS